ncbi:MAG: YqgE/AlgH family protein [Planctomycetaceae bacterium]
MSDSLRGHYLIAGKHLRDPNFYRTVVLMVEHGEEGAMGLVINRPSSVKVAHALAEHFNLPDQEQVVFIGGPVEPSHLFILHNVSHLHLDDEEEGLTLLPGVHVTNRADVLEKVMAVIAEGQDAGGGDLRYRILSGCAGWAPGQLESELARGDWYVQPANSELLFLDDPYEVWEATLRRFDQLSQLAPHPPGNPEWN